MKKWIVIALVFMTSLAFNLPNLFAQQQDSTQQAQAVCPMAGKQHGGHHGGGQNMNCAMRQQGTCPMHQQNCPYAKNQPQDNAQAADKAAPKPAKQ